MGIVLIISLLINIVLGLWIVALYWDKKLGRDAVIRSAYEHRPLYVIHPGLALGSDGQEHTISVPELARLYKLPVDKWIPVNPKFDKKDWKKVYGEQAIHLYPLPYGMEYESYLRDVLHNGIRPDHPPMVIESEKKPLQIDTRRQYPITLAEAVESLDKILILKRYNDNVLLLNNNYLRVGTRVNAYDAQGTRISSQYYRVSMRPSPDTGGWKYTFNIELPKDASELRIART